MSDISIHLITEPTAIQVNAAVALCIRAYANDVVIRVMTGGDHKLYDPLFRNMILAGALEGTLYFAMDNLDVCTSHETSRLVGVSVWFQPGRALNSSEEQKKLGLYEFFSGLSTQMQEWWNKIYVAELSHFLDQALGVNGVVDSWYASNIAVEPSYQRRGIATMLMDIIFKQASETGGMLALCAGNERNATIYERLGFIRKGTMVMCSPSGDLQFPVICLSRGSASSQTQADLQRE